MTEDVRASDEGQCRPQGSWEQQWEQVLIGSQRVSAVYAGRWDNIADAVFDIRAFFLTCHHLGEWIGGDETVPQAARDRVGEVVESSVELKICTDIANGSKHRTLITAKTGDLSTGIASNDPTWVYVGPGGGTQYNFRVTSDGKEYDVSDLARACVSEWYRFLLGEGLLPPPPRRTW